MLTACAEILMTQKNHSEVNDEGVSVTTTPISSVAASATAKLSAAADTSTSFNVKSATSIVALDTYSIGCLSMATSKKIGTGVTYQCGKNIAAFSRQAKEIHMFMPKRLLLRMKTAWLFAEKISR